jgi:DNA-binding LytR/AlgR family response regulator
VYTAGSKIEYYGNFVSLLQKIDRSAFIQCHQGYIVNIQKARGFRDKVLLLDGNHTVPVSRSFVESTKEALARKLFAGRDQR